MISGRVLDLILVLILLEGVGGAAFLFRRHLSGLITPFILFLLSGACLMIAIRAVLSAMPAGVVLALLGASFAAHLACLVTAWHRFHNRTAS